MNRKRTHTRLERQKISEGARPEQQSITSTFDIAESVQETRASQGQNLTDETRAFMEPRFGHDFSQVRIHTDERAAESAQALDALAYTVGQDIVFGTGQYVPETQEGRGLLAHELTHVVQQRGMNNAGPTTIGPAEDSYEQEADKISSSITTNASPGIGDVTGEAQRVSGNTSRDLKGGGAPAATGISASPGAGALIQRKPTEEQLLERREKKFEEQMEAREEKFEEQTNERLANLENHQKAQDIHQKAVDCDMKWRAKFNQQFAKYHEAVDRISAGLQAATKGFQDAQTAQAEFEAAVMSVFKAALTIAGGLEWAFVPGLGKLGAGAKATAEEIKESTETVEHIVSTTHAVADVGLDVAKEAAAKKPETPATESISGVQMPAGSMGGDPLAFLTSNSALLEQHKGNIEQAFIDHSNQTQAYSDADWLKFDLAGREAGYQNALEGLQKVAGSSDDLVSDNEIALVLERHLWARWISEQAESMDKTAEAMKKESPYGMMYESEMYSAKNSFTPGSEIEKRLIEINVDIFAGVELTGHWYSSNSPDNWRELLIKWANNYDGTISKTIQKQQMKDVEEVFKPLWGR